MKKWKRLLSVLLAFAIMFTGITLDAPESKASFVDNPTPIRLNDKNWTPGMITQAGDAKFYSVTLPSDGWLTYSYQGKSIGDSYCALLNETTAGEYRKDNIYTSSDTNPKTIDRTLALERGTYIIKVWGYGNHTGSFNLSASFQAAGNNEKKNNETFETAQTLSKDRKVTGFFSQDDRLDFFRVNLSKKERVRFIFTSYVDDDIYITIYDQDNRVISTKDLYYSSPNNPKVYEYQETLNPGVYYIKVTPYNSGDFGRYNIQYKEKIIAKSIKITTKNNKKEVVAGQKIKLNATISPSNTTEKTIQWQSGNTSIAQIDENTGMVTTYSPGRVKFTANALDGSNVSKTFTLTVKPKKVSNLYVSSPRSRQMYVSYSSQWNASGYQIQYATNKSFKNAKLKRTRNTYITFKRLPKNTRYYVRVRAYLKSGKTYYYGAWSSRKSIRISK